MPIFALLLIFVSACAAPPSDAPSAHAATLEGTREGYGVLRLLNDGTETTQDFLDHTVALDRRAAKNLVVYRDGEDAVFGTADDELFDTIAEVDAVRWVGDSALAKLVEFAAHNDYVPGPHDELGVFDGVPFTFAEAEAVLALVNEADEAALVAAGVPSRARSSILAAQPIDSLATLAGLYWVGPRTLEHLKAAAAPAEAVAMDCTSNADCTEGLRCTGKPYGYDYGKCRDWSVGDGFQDPCAEDADCNAGLICIAQTVYDSGYCASSWMRDSFEVPGVLSIPETVMSEPTAMPVLVYGQASVPEDIIIDIMLDHTDPSSLWIGIQPPTGQEPVTLWDGPTATGEFPGHFVDKAIYRDDAVNGSYQLLVQNIGGRGVGELRGFTLTVSSRWD